MTSVDCANDVAAPEEPVLLLVEDDDVDAERVTRWIRMSPNLPWTVVRTSTLADALDHVRREPPAVAVVDLSLPDATRLEVVEALRSESPRTPVVVQSGLDAEHASREAIGLGAQDYLSKDSLTRESLERAVTNAVTRHALTETRELLDASRRLGLRTRRVRARGGARPPGPGSHGTSPRRPTARQSGKPD